MSQNKQLKVCVVGLGSMGKRRIRCLLALNYTNIYAYDPREDRVQEAIRLYNVKAEKIENIDKHDIIIISTPPDKHLDYIKLSKKSNIPCFVEASVLLEDTLLAIESEGDNSLVHPSCTFNFHPLIKQLRVIIESKSLGYVTNFSYHSGQYLPDWHPWEKITDFYVGKKNTGGAREIVPFELTWIYNTFGVPNKLLGVKTRTRTLPQIVFYNN